MSVATHLGLDPASTAFIELEQHWGAPGLSSSRDWRGRVSSHALRGWLAAAEPAEADEVLHTLATLGSPSGADDLAAASVLAWALLPGACAWPTAFVDCRRGSMSWLPPNCGWRSDHSRGTGCTKWLRTFSPTPALAYCGMRRTQPNEASRQGMDNTHLVDPSASFWNRHAAGLGAVPSAADELLALDSGVQQRDYRRGHKTAAVVG